MIYVLLYLIIALLFFSGTVWWTWGQEEAPVTILTSIYFGGLWPLSLLVLMYVIAKLNQ